MALIDNRITDRQDCILGAAKRNLAYQKFMFSVYPKFALDLKSANIDKTLSFIHHFERSDLMSPGKTVKIKTLDDNTEKKEYVFSTSGKAGIQTIVNHCNNLNQIIARCLLKTSKISQYLVKTANRMTSIPELNRSTTSIPELNRSINLLNEKIDGLIINLDLTVNKYITITQLEVASAKIIADITNELSEKINSCPCNKDILEHIKNISIIEQKTKP
uniref:Uncharacterized protein n=1 Tax=Lactuca sativa TaxID=4236 RepID=A0A9R1UCC8_LACSA|nr:hypothetical protein LSAT_V11C900505880 [Lactuca sativa]